MWGILDVSKTETSWRLNILIQIHASHIYFQINANNIHRQTVLISQLYNTLIHKIYKIHNKPQISKVHIALCNHVQVSRYNLPVEFTTKLRTSLEFH